MIDENTVTGHEWARRVGCLWLNKEKISIIACFHCDFSIAVYFDHMISCGQWHRRKRSGTEQAN